MNDQLEHEIACAIAQATRQREVAEQAFAEARVALSMAAKGAMLDRGRRALLAAEYHEGCATRLARRR